MPPLYLFPVLFITLSLFIWLIAQGSSFANAFKRGYFFGFAFFGFGLLWIGNALLIDTTPLMLLYPIVFIASGLFFGLFIAIPSAFTFYFKNPLGKYLAICSLIVFFEWIRSFFLTGFPWNLWGSALGFSLPLLQTASIGGTYLLSLFVWLICGSFYLYLQSSNHKKLTKTILFCISLLAFLYGIGTYRLSQENLTVSATKIRIVQPSIPQSLKWNLNSLEQNLDEYISLSQKKSLKDISMVIWGETASPFPLDLDIAHNYKVRQAIPEKGYLATGQIRYFFRDGEQKAANSFMIFDKKGNPLDYYDKSHLVPFGEYIPLREYLPAWLRPLANTIGTFTAGEGPNNIKLTNIPSLGTIICYEAIFPHKITSKQNRPEWLINPTNDGWYGNSFGPHQHFAATRLRAIEDGLTIVRAANSGISALFSPYGKILGQIKLNQKNFLDLNLPQTLSVKTFYSKYGNSAVLFLCLFIFILGFILNNKEKTY